MTKAEARMTLGNAVYQACLVFETLEHQGLVRGNGHHLAQWVALTAMTLLDERWIGGTEECESQAKQ